MDKWLSIIGIEEMGLAVLDKASVVKLLAADKVIADKRFHLEIQKLGFEGRLSDWPIPFMQIYDQLKTYKNDGLKIVILATGDPLWFGAGASIAKHFDNEGLEIIPARSGFQMAAAKLGWNIDYTNCLTLHGRPIETLRPYIKPYAQLLILAHDRHSPLAIANYLKAHGFDQAMMTVLSNLGGKSEAVSFSLSAEEYLLYPQDKIADFSIIAVACPETQPNLKPLSLPGIEDDEFDHDGKITKRDIRASAVIRLSPQPNGILWDLGCGAASVAIEWLLLSPYSNAYGIDNLSRRLNFAKTNLQKFGLTNRMSLFEGDNQSIIPKLPAPDAIFFGGGITRPAIELAFSALKLGGVMVLHAVTMESEHSLIHAYEKYGRNKNPAEFTRFALSHLEPISEEFSAWKPAMTVTQLKLVKHYETN